MNTRQQDIVVLVKKEGEITIKELAQRLAVSEMTIHRDLDYLQEQRFLYKNAERRYSSMISTARNTAFTPMKSVR